MTALKLYQDLEIILKYWPNSTINTEHDTLFVGPMSLSDPIQPSDYQLLIDKGWSFNSLLSCWQHFI